jgi:4-hydroxyphenylpyruvate dioxygenase
MTTPPSSPPVSQFLGFDHLTWYVGNAKLTAQYYILSFGFIPIAYRGLETGYRSTATHVIRHGNVIFAFTSSLGTSTSNNNNNDNDQVSQHILKHGDGVKDVAFRVRDCKHVFHLAVKAGAKIISEPKEYRDEIYGGSVILATIATYGDTVHTLVQRNESYKGPFLPGFQAAVAVAVPTELNWDFKFIDHVVGNQGPNEMEQIANWYRDKLGFHRFWTVDDKMIHTEFSSLRSIVMADESLAVKMPINEPAQGKKKSQIQEFVDFYNGPGVQHIALNTNNCIGTVQKLKSKGVEFLSVPDSYYKDLQVRLELAKIKIKENLNEIQQFNILVDFDDQTGNYLLQIFTKPLQDRPTVFIEVIQRCGHQGFGAGNFKALFESIEREQERRGNL